MLAFVAFAPGPSAAIAKVDTAIKAAAANIFTIAFIMSFFIVLVMLFLFVDSKLQHNTPLAYRL
jgi:hypothetical protein